MNVGNNGWRDVDLVQTLAKPTSLYVMDDVI